MNEYICEWATLANSQAISFSQTSRYNQLSPNDHLGLSGEGGHFTSHADSSSAYFTERCRPKATLMINVDVHLAPGKFSFVGDCRFIENPQARRFHAHTFARHGYCAEQKHFWYPGCVPLTHPFASSTLFRRQRRWQRRSTINEFQTQ